VKSLLPLDISRTLCKIYSIKKIALLLIILVFGVVGLAFAETSLEAEVDKATLSTDDTLTYKLSITSTDQALPLPRLPRFDGFNIISTAQSSNVSFAQSEVKTQVVYAVVLSPTAVGKFKIEASSLKIKNKVLTTDSFQIEVTQGKTKPPPQQEESPLPESAEPQYSL